MALVKPTSIQKHPIAWGLLWASLTVALIWLIDYVRGENTPDLFIAMPIFAVAGLAWGYSVKRHFDRKAGKL